MKKIQSLRNYSDSTIKIIESEIPDTLYNLIETCCINGHSSMTYNGNDNEITECSNNFLKQIEEGEEI